VVGLAELVNKISQARDVLWQGHWPGRAGIPALQWREQRPQCVESDDVAPDQRNFRPRQGCHLFWDVQEGLCTTPFEGSSKRIVAIRRDKYAIYDQQLIPHRLTKQLCARARGFHQRNTLRTCHQHDRGQLWVRECANRARVALALRL